jgi:hypothetical protein
MYDESEEPLFWSGLGFVPAIKSHSHGKAAKSGRVGGLCPHQRGRGGGDLHYMSVCDYDPVSREAPADVSGHGNE